MTEQAVEIPEETTNPELNCTVPSYIWILESITAITCSAKIAEKLEHKYNLDKSCTVLIWLLASYILFLIATRINDTAHQLYNNYQQKHDAPPELSITDTHLELEMQNLQRTVLPVQNTQPIAPVNRGSI